MNVHLRNGLRTGIIFGIVLIFLVLIGFPTTVSDLLGGILKDEASKPVFGLTPAMLNMLIFFGLVGLWAGASGARPVKAGGKFFSLAGGVISGALAGFLLSLLIYTIGSLDAAGVKMNTYLDQLLPDAVHLFTLKMSPVNAGVVYFILFIIVGALGAPPF